MLMPPERNSARMRLLPLLVAWFFCASLGGLAHLTCHVDDANSRNPLPAVPHACLICQSLAQSARSDISTQVRASLQPVFTSFYLPHNCETRAVASAPMRATVFNRGPPLLRS